MTITKESIQKLEVALYIAKTAEKTGKQWKTSDDKLASVVGETLAIMVTYEKPEQVAKHVEKMISLANIIGLPGVKSWTYISLCINWLSWAWHEQGNDELGEAWAEGWYKIDEYTRNTLKGKDLTYYEKETN